MQVGFFFSFSFYNVPLLINSALLGNVWLFGKFNDGWKSFPGPVNTPAGCSGGKIKTNNSQKTCAAKYSVQPVYISSNGWVLTRLQSSTGKSASGWKVLAHDALMGTCHFLLSCSWYVNRLFMSEKKWLEVFFKFFYCLSCGKWPSIKQTQL